MTRRLGARERRAVDAVVASVVDEAQVAVAELGGVVVAGVLLLPPELREAALRRVVRELSVSLEAQAAVGLGVHR